MKYSFDYGVEENHWHFLILVRLTNYNINFTNHYKTRKICTIDLLKEKTVK